MTAIRSVLRFLFLTTRGRRFMFSICVALFLIIVMLMHYSMTVERYYTLGTGWSEDQAISNHLLWNISHRLSIENTVLHPTKNFLCNHFSLIYFPLSVIHLLWPTPQMAFLMSDIIVMGGVFLLFLTAAKRLKTHVGAFLAVMLLLSHEVMDTNLLVHGFRDTAMSLGFLSLALWGYEMRRFWPYVAGLVLAAMCKEDVIFVVIGFTLLPLVHRRGKKWTLFPLIFGICYGLAAFTTMHYLNKVAAAGNPQAQDMLLRNFQGYGYLGQTPGEMLVNAIKHPGLWIKWVTSPAKIRSMLELFGPFGFLSLLGPEFLLVPLSQFAELYMTQHEHVADNGYWYVAPTVPFVFYSAVVGAARVIQFVPFFLAEVAGMWRRDDWSLPLRLTRERLGYVVCAVAVVGLGFAAWRPFHRVTSRFKDPSSSFIFRPDAPQRELVTALQRAVPPRARICTQYAYALPLSSRPFVHILPFGFNDAEYIIINRKSSFYPADKPEYDRLVAQLQDRSVFTRIPGVGDIEIYHRSPSSGPPAPEATTKTLTPAARPPATQPPEAGNGLLGEFYALPELPWRLPDFPEGPPQFVCRFPTINFPFTEGEFKSADGIVIGMRGPFAARFSGQITLLESGEHIFIIESDDGFRLWIDDKVVGEFTEVRVFSASEIPLSLEKGPHRIRLDYFDNSRPAGLRLSYKLPSGERMVVPEQALMYAPADGGK